MIDGPERPREPSFDRWPLTDRGEEVAAPFRALAGAPTPLDDTNASRCLEQAWHALFGEPAPRPALDLLWAQWALETARGRAMRGNNFAGIKAGHGGAVYPTTEGSGAERTRVLGRFRTYGTPEEGARDQVALIARKYPLALEALRRGDAAAFVAELARGGFFTADPAAYRRGIERLVSERKAPGGLTSKASSTTSAVLVEGVLASLRPRERV